MSERIDEYILDCALEYLQEINTPLSEKEIRLREWQEHVASDPSPKVQRILKRARLHEEQRRSI